MSLGYLKVDQFVLFRLEEASEWIAVHYMMARIYIYLVIHVNYKLRAVLNQFQNKNKNKKLNSLFGCVFLFLIVFVSVHD